MGVSSPFDEATTIPTQYKNDVLQADRDADAYKVRIGSLRSPAACNREVGFPLNNGRLQFGLSALKSARERTRSAGGLATRSVTSRKVPIAEVARFIR
jgi:hypothetical protein